MVRHSVQICWAVSFHCRCATMTTPVPAEVTRLMTMVPKLPAVKVSTRKWKPPLMEQDMLKRIPKGDLLCKARLWTAEEYKTARDVLGRPPLRLEVQDDGCMTKVAIAATDSGINIFPRTPALPKTISTLPLRAVLIDLRSVEADDVVECMDNVPGKFKLSVLPVILFGRPDTVDMATLRLMHVLGGSWSGERRTFIVWTADKDAMYTAARRQIVIFTPDVGELRRRQPPYFNIAHAEPPTLGWVAIFGYLQALLLPDSNDESTSQGADWLYVISDDVALAALLSTRLDNTPSVALCPLRSEESIPDIAGHVSEALKGTQNIPVLQWTQIMERTIALAPIFEMVQQADVAENLDSVSSDSEINMPLVPLPPNPKPPAKRRAKPGAEGTPLKPFKVPQARQSKEKEKEAPKDKDPRKDKDQGKGKKRKMQADEETTAEPRPSEDPKPSAPSSGTPAAALTASELTRRLSGSGLRKPIH